MTWISVAFVKEPQRQLCVVKTTLQVLISKLNSEDIVYSHVPTKGHGHFGTGERCVNIGLFRDLDVQVPGSSMSLSWPGKHLVDWWPTVRNGICELQGRFIDFLSSSIMVQKRSVASVRPVSLVIDLAKVLVWDLPLSMYWRSSQSLNHVPWSQSSYFRSFWWFLRPSHLPEDTAHKHSSQVCSCIPLSSTSAATQSGCRL